MPTKFNPFTGNLTPTPKPLSDSEIKEQYEANADTNAYTDAEKTKLAGVATGAEVNVQSDWDATSGDAHILNKPTVYTTTNSATPPAGAIEGDTWWDSETGDKYIYYVDADGGRWVQSSSSSNLLTADVGTAAYLDVEEVATSQQGVKADSALQPGDIGTTVAPVNNPTFTGTALILPNNSRVNGVEHFYQTSKPTVRGNASALVAGDRWWKTDTGTEWFWNGTYWLSSNLIELMGPQVTVSLNAYEVNKTVYTFPIIGYDYFLLYFQAGRINNFRSEFSYSLFGSGNQQNQLIYDMGVLMEIERIDLNLAMGAGASLGNVYILGYPSVTLKISNLTGSAVTTVPMFYYIGYRKIYRDY